MEKNLDCLFCKIISGSIPSDRVYEDNEVLAFLDITPINPGHTLVTPKKHTENIYSISEKDLQNVMVAVKKIAKAIKEGLGADGVNVFMNNDAPAGQIIFHSHIHVIPRFKNDGYVHWRGNRNVPKEKLEEAREKIKKQL